LMTEKPNSPEFKWGSSIKFTRRTSLSYQTMSPVPLFCEFGQTYLTISCARFKLKCSSVRFCKNVKFVGSNQPQRIKLRQILEIINPLKTEGILRKLKISKKWYNSPKSGRISKIMVPPESLSQYLSNEYRCHGILTES
jgi:hypothetical protein